MRNKSRLRSVQGVSLKPLSLALLNRRSWRYLAVGLLLLGQLAVADAELAVPGAKASLSVSVVSPEWVEWDNYILANGPIMPWQEAIIASEIGGQRIDSLQVDVGDQVLRGQLMAQLAQDLVLADLAQAKAQVALAQANLGEARANAQRANTLKSKEALSTQKIDQYLTSEEAAAANLAVQEAHLLAQQIRLEKTRILAVDDGVVVARSANLGAVVQVGSELYRLVRQDKLEWQAEVSGRDSHLLREGQVAHLVLPGNQTIQGVVRRIAPTFDPQTRNLKVFIALPPNKLVKAGMFAQGKIVVGAARAMVVPQSAVIPRDGKYYVFTVNQDRHVEQHVVTIGRAQQDAVEILEGLAPDDPVVATGGAFLNDGDVVVVIESTSANPPAEQGRPTL